MQPSEAGNGPLNVHACQLPLPVPQPPGLRLSLLIFRRMATHGLHDAQATMIAVDAFGAGFRRPLVLMRAFVAELAGGSRRRLLVAPCCALRMTMDEARVLGVLVAANAHGDTAAHHLRVLTDRYAIAEILSAAAALNAALADLGRPLELRA